MNLSYIYPALGFKNDPVWTLLERDWLNASVRRRSWTPCRGSSTRWRFTAGRGWTWTSAGRDGASCPGTRPPRRWRVDTRPSPDRRCLYQSHVQEIKKSLSANGQHQQQHQQQVSDAISVQSEGNGAQREHRHAPYTACWSPFHCRICRVYIFKSDLSCICTCKK